MKDKTHLEEKLIAIINQDGAISVEQYMETCLGDPEYGYYMGRDPFGRGGDFITAPEVSQMFGEAIGVWFATAWLMMGKPEKINLIELGPGRGTLMVDMLRALKVAEGFAEAVEVHMVEMSSALRKLQGQTLKGLAVDVHWHQRFEQVPAGPCLIIANEFFDALALKQIVRVAGNRGGNRGENRSENWHERMVEVDDDDKLRFGVAPEPLAKSDVPHWARKAKDGDIAEYSPQRMAMAERIGAHVKKHGGAGLIIDYGHALSFVGDTFQAVHKHKFVDVLHLPGHSDLTSHVDFEALAEGFEAGGAVVHGPRTQRGFLIAMGLREREAALRKNARARERIMLSRQAERLVGEKQMGHLFKVLAITDGTLKEPHPFGVPAETADG